MNARDSWLEELLNEISTNAEKSAAPSPTVVTYHSSALLENDGRRSVTPPTCLQHCDVVVISQPPSASGFGDVAEPVAPVEAPAISWRVDPPAVTSEEAERGAFELRNAYQASGARPKVKLRKVSPSSSSDQTAKATENLTRKASERGYVFNPIFRPTISDSSAIRAGWWTSPVAPKVRVAKDARTEEDASSVQIEMSPVTSAVAADDPQATVAPTSNSNFGSVHLSCEICGDICFPGELSSDNKCGQCSNSNDLEENNQDESSVTCNYCSSKISLKNIDKHEGKCRKNPDNINKTRNSKRVETRRHCKYCRNVILEEFADQHEHECHQNPFNKASRDAAERQKMDELIAQFRQAPNPEPAEWDNIPARSSRSTERRSERFGFISGIGMDSLPIPCEFCLYIFPAQHLYEHEVRVFACLLTLLRVTRKE